jgi:hypothetical protein
MADTYNPSSWKAQAGRSRVRPAQTTQQDCVSKTNKQKNRAGGVTQVIEYLPHKLEALSSNPSIA